MADRKFLYKIEANQAGMKVLELLNEKGYSRQLQTNLKKDAECVRVNGQESYLNRILNEGDELSVWIKETVSSEKIPPVDLPVNIIYEDEDIVVVDKPAKMPIHPSLNNYENTLGNAMAYRYLSQGDKFVFRCINRLDRDTTGLTIIAKHMLSACVLYDQMVEGKIHRTYYAIVEGSFSDKGGIIDLPIARKEGSTIERIVDPDNGEKALTHYEVIGEGNGLSYIRLWLETGRTHQIRVHMKAIGHPLVGDFLYNPLNNQMDRQALHAGELEFIHPVTGSNLKFSVPLHEDMEKVVAQIRK